MYVFACVCVFQHLGCICECIARNVGHMKKQLLSLGFQFDWETVSISLLPFSLFLPVFSLSLSLSLHFPFFPFLSLSSSLILEIYFSVYAGAIHMLSLLLQVDPVAVSAIVQTWLGIQKGSNGQLGPCGLYSASQWAGDHTCRPLLLSLLIRTSSGWCQRLFMAVGGQGWAALPKSMVLQDYGLCRGKQSD